MGTPAAPAREWEGGVVLSVGEQPCLLSDTGATIRFAYRNVKRYGAPKVMLAAGDRVEFLRILGKDGTPLAKVHQVRIVSAAAAAEDAAPPLPQPAASHGAAPWPPYQPVTRPWPPSPTHAVSGSRFASATDSRTQYASALSSVPGASPQAQGPDHTPPGGEEGSDTDDDWGEPPPLIADVVGEVLGDLPARDTQQSARRYDHPSVAVATAMRDHRPAAAASSGPARQQLGEGNLHVNRELRSLPAAAAGAVHTAAAPQPTGMRCIVVDGKPIYYDKVISI
eukprot:TRINITY_DN1213_c0_g1_i1.p1 TRINITY_DN1213_c0_g1~~TRINITY_DN1213_c0_g1_i1.p1  ORF type:complete len:281 (+),score=31.83 TRINITY_DN1213_c0_g1_i1:129-971(+)